MLPLTFAALAILTGVLFLLRLRWLRLSQRTRTTLIGCAGAALILYSLIFITGWDTSSNHLNAAIYWAAVAGYEFFLLLFTLLRPRWLTTIIAAVLMLPVLSASPFLPLAELFNPAPHTTVSIGPNFISDRVAWGTGTGPNSGFDLVIYSQPSWTHFLRHRRQGSRYFNGQCDASRAYATLQPDGKHVLMSCPAAPNQQPDAARSLVVKLY
ncbi:MULTISPECIES: hypothetical protein [Acidobacteriaceae]|uniref:hypothetical protein n=1 Tax=Acidobacteriaceae TaxID=204434 RepID=UPI00131D59C8|nr:MULTISPECIES: hypothetical protein [Acidobacteriaceae]MDW5266735.1 hypothetical protein [Edaphobacter sp.]